MSLRGRLREGDDQNPLSLSTRFDDERRQLAKGERVFAASKRQLDCTYGRSSDCTSDSGRTSWAYQKSKAAWLAATAFASYADDTQTMLDTKC